MVNQTSMESVQIQTRDKHDRSLMNATGFIVDHEGSLYLVSNRHVLSGRVGGSRNEGNDPDAREGSSVHDPWSVKITTANLDAGGVLIHKEVVVELIDVDLNCRWIQHGIEKELVDIAALQLPDELRGFARILDMHKIPFPEVPTHRFSASVPSRVMVVRYPLGIDGGSPGLGIWVQGIIASEPSLPIGRSQRFLIDSRTRRGMSGSPVYLYPAGQFVSVSPGISSLVGDDITQFIGIYSGRISEVADLGFVWHTRLINEVLSAGVAGTTFG